MNRRMAIIILACLVGLWSAAASAQDKINPNRVIDPIQKMPPMISPPAQDRIDPSQIMDPIQRRGGLVEDRVRQAEEAARDAAAARDLEQGSGLDAAMGAGVVADDTLGFGTDDDTPGFGTDDDTLTQRLCKLRVFRQSRMCGGGSAGGEIGSFNTESGTYDSTKPGGARSFDGRMAGSRVPDRRGPASDDDRPDDHPLIEDEATPDGRAGHWAWYDDKHYRHDYYYAIDDAQTTHVIHEVHNQRGDLAYESRGTIVPDRSRGAQPGDRVVHEVHREGHQAEDRRRTRHCRGNDSDCDWIQPSESGPPRQAKAWFCNRNPEKCRPVAPGSQIDPANPDGDGTRLGTRTTADVPKVSRGAVIDPGSGDSPFLGHTGGGGSLPLDMKDPIDPVKPAR